MASKWEDTVISREEAKKYLCSGCTGTRASGSYFNNDCKGDAPKCQRITDFIRGWHARDGEIEEAEKRGAEKVVDITKKFIPDHKYEYYIDEVGKQQRKHTFDRCARCEWQALLKDLGIEVKE